VGHCAVVVRAPGDQERQRWFERRGATRQHGMRVLELDVARRLIYRVQADALTYVTIVATTVTASVLLRSKFAAHNKPFWVSELKWSRAARRVAVATRYYRWYTSTTCTKVISQRAYMTFTFTRFFVILNFFCDMCHVKNAKIHHMVSVVNPCM
jgi:hypothetical protein